MGSSPSAAVRTVITLGLALAGAAVRADPGNYVVTPYDQQGLLGLELRYWTVEPRRGRTQVWPELGLSWGVDSHWTTRLLASWIGPEGGRLQLSSWNWQNLWLLTQGEHDYDLGLHTQFSRSPGEGHALELGPAWQTDLARWRLNANLFWDYDSRRRDTRLKLQWRGLYRLQPGWRLGVEGFSELGPWRNGLSSDRASDRVGPALQAAFWGAGQDELRLSAAYLVGRTYGRSGRMFTMQLQWLR